MEDNEDQPEDVREATPVETEIERAGIDEPSGEPARDLPESSELPTAKEPSRKLKKDKKDDCAKKLRKKMKNDGKSQTITVLVPDKPCTLPRIDVIPRHCLSKKEWIDMLATPSRKCPASCGKRPVERKLRPISPRIDELARPPKHRMLNTLEARGDILPAELVDKLVRVLEGETCLTPEQAERLLRDRRRKSPKKTRKRKHSCKSNDVNFKSPESHSPLPLDKEAVTCQYMMAEAFVKSILQWKSTIPKEEFKDIADIIVKRLGTILEYTPVDKADKTTQQMRFLADIIAAWIAGVLFEVAEDHREELEKQWEERKKMMEEEEEESESSESELEEFIPVMRDKSKISEKSKRGGELAKDPSVPGGPGGRLVDGRVPDGAGDEATRETEVPGESGDGAAEQEDEREQERSDDKRDDPSKKDDGDGGTGAGGTLEEPPPPEDTQEPSEQPPEPPADEEPSGGDAGQPEPTESVEPVGSQRDLPADEEEDPGTVVPSRESSKTLTDIQEFEKVDQDDGDETDHEGRESEITIVPGTISPMKSELTPESIAGGDAVSVPAVDSVIIPATTPGTEPGTVPGTVPPTIPPTPGEPDGVSMKTEVIPESQSVADGIVSGTVAGTIPATPGEPDGVSIKTEIIPESDSIAGETMPGTIPGTIPPTPGQPDGVSIKTEAVPFDTIPDESIQPDVPSDRVKFEDVPDMDISSSTLPQVKSEVKTAGIRSISSSTLPQVKSEVKTAGIRSMTDQTVDGTRMVQQDDIPERNLKKMLQTDVPFLDLLRILELIENAVAKERENFGEDLTIDRIHRAIYEKLERLVRAESPERFSSHLQDVLDVLSGKVAHWVKDTMTSSELKFLEENPPLIGSDELKKFADWIYEVSERTETWTIWMQNMMDQLLAMQAIPVTRRDWQEWTRKFAADALLWRRYFLESSHHAHHNRTMLAGRQIVRNEDFKYPEWHESPINTVESVKE